MEIQNTKNRAIFLPTAEYVKQTLYICKWVKMTILSLLNKKNVKNWSGFPIKDFGNDSL